MTTPQLIVLIAMCIGFGGLLTVTAIWFLCRHVRFGPFK